MKRILITGMSGTGKSTTLRELAARGYPTLDMDDPGCSEYGPDGDWIWVEARAQAFLSQAEGRARFISGCATNQVKFYPQFDEIILLSAPAAVLTKRLATRTTNPYGKRPEELAETLGYLETVEPLLRRRATLEIATTVPLEHVIAAILQLVDR
jgi:shikimate kinase